LREEAETTPLDLFAARVIEATGYKQMLEQQIAQGHEDARDRLENLSQLVSNVKSYCDQRGADATLEGYLEEIALISDIDNYNEDSDQVVMMTIHSAKGLEFPYVFLVGMEEGVFPSDMSRYSEADLEEERRLAYVGITRAKKELYLSNSVTRMLYGQTRRNEPSRFLAEIAPEYLEETSSPALERRAHSGGWGDGYSEHVPGGASGYSGASGWGRSAGSYGSRAQGSYLSREYGAAQRSANAGYGRSTAGDYTGSQGSAGGFGSGYAGRGAATSSYGNGNGAPAAPRKTTAKAPITFGTSASVPNTATSAQDRNYAPGDVVEHKVFGRGVVQRVTPAAGDHIVEIRFDKVGIKKTMANFAPLKKITSEDK
jgi:DNA helicase-2/ATP-dependent DNA helicase PcrA